MDANVFVLFHNLVPVAAMKQFGDLKTVGKTRKSSRSVLQQLAEIEAISAGPSRYPWGNRDKAVDRRARALTVEYRGALAKLDTKYLGTLQEQT